MDSEKRALEMGVYEFDPNEDNKECSKVILAMIGLLVLGLSVMVYSCALY